MVILPVVKAPTVARIGGKSHEATGWDTEDTASF